MSTLARFAPLVLLLALLVPTAALADDAAYQAARAEALAGNAAKAITLAQAAIEKDAEDFASARLLQDLLLATGRAAELDKICEKVPSVATRDYLRLRASPPKEAVDGFKKLQSQDTAPSFVGLDLAYALWRADKRSSASSEAKTYVREHPQDPEGHVLVARLTLEKSTRGAREPLEKALALEPGRADAVLLLADVLHIEKKPAEARKALEAGLAKYPKNVDLRLGLAADQVRMDELDVAALALEDIAKEHPRLADVHAWHAFALRRLGELKDAEAAALRALALDANHVRALETLGFVHMKAQKYEESLDAYGLALKQAPERVEPYVGIGFVQILTNDLDNAKEMLGRALKLDKNHVDLNLKWGILQYILGKYRTAKKHLKVVLADDELNVPALRYSGYILLAEGKAKEAAKLLQTALDVSPYDAMTMRMLGRALFDLGKKDEALVQFERAVETDDKDAWAHFDLGKIFDDRGEFEAAKQEYEEAVALDESLPWPHIYLAEIWDDIDGEPVPALKHYKRFLELGGPDPDEAIKKRIDQLEGD